MSTANVATKRTFLYIKEVADLFGITAKTVRHYHKLGLLPEPERSEADYRLYTGKKLWRLLERNREMFQTFAHASKTGDEDSPTTTVLGDVMDEKLQSMLTPAQHFFVKCLGAAGDKMRAA